MVIWVIVLIALLVTLVAVSCCNAASRADEMSERFFQSATEIDSTTTSNPVVHYPVPLEQDLQDYIVSKSIEAGVSPCVVFGIIDVETYGTFNPELVGDNGNSFGLMQIYRSCHEDRIQRLGIDNLYDPYQNVTVGIDLLGELLRSYTIEETLNFYNSGSTTGAPHYAELVMTRAEQIEEGIMVTE